MTPTYPELVNHLLKSAKEMDSTDPNFGIDFTDFLSVMWENDDELKRFNLSRETYHDALADAWAKLYT